MNTMSPNTICDWCNTKFFKPNAWKKRNDKHFCSRDCNNQYRSYVMSGKVQPQLKVTPEGHRKSRLKVMGENNPAWKGGVTFRKRKGRYPSNVKYVRCPQEFISMARKDGYVMEHRLIMAQHLDRNLSRVEVVHHVNHDVTDNRIENLMLFDNNAEHKRFEGESGYLKEYYSHHRTRTNHQNS
jgi:hypothetical protein